MQALANPIVTVNDVNIAIKPNSFSYTDGFGERNVRPQTNGPNVVENVVTENPETELSMCKFMLISTDDNANIVRTWLNNLDNNTITAVQGSFSRSFRRGTVINNPEIAISQDGEIEVEFKCEKAA